MYVYSLYVQEPSVKAAINILSQVEKQLGPAYVAYWVGPNTLLTLSGARGYCDGVFYDEDENKLLKWQKEITECMDVIKSLVAVPFSDTSITKNPMGDRLASYDLILMPGLKYCVNRTKMLSQEDKGRILNKESFDDNFINYICDILKTHQKFQNHTLEQLQYIAQGILLGYPDEAIIESQYLWDENDPFAEPLIDADILGATYYDAPRPIYSYPRSLISSHEIVNHERSWSKLLKEYYNSSFHKRLENDSAFRRKVIDIGLKPK